MQSKSLVLIFVVAAIVGAIFYLDSRKAGSESVVLNGQAPDIAVPDELTASSTSATASTSSIANQASMLRREDKAKKYHRAKELVSPSGFINTTGNLPITISQYIGKKVILIDFWTYSCINCQRTTPYLNAWYDKYEKDGLIIIGVHTPEFEFEKVYDNVAKAVQKEGIKYPVVLDNDYGTWTAYQNQYWPRKYLIDIDGYVVYDHIGEGAYDETEKKIQDLLAERNEVLGESSKIDASISVPKNAVTTIQAQSPETYFGSARNEYLANGKAGLSGAQSFILPKSFDANSLYLGGSWNIESQDALSQGETSIIYRFKAKEVYLVAGADIPTDIEVLLDGMPVSARGVDVAVDGGKTIVHISDERLYHLIDLPQMGEHTLQIRAKAGLRAFTFTFG